MDIYNINEQKKDIPYICVTLIVLNTIMWIITEIWGEKIYHLGDFSIRTAIWNAEYYRFITSMFLHGGVAHLMNNMLILFLAGETLEKNVGRGWFLLVYFFSGICGSLVSAGIEVFTNNYYNSIGASGAIFGLIGALLAFVIRGKGVFEGITLPRIILTVAMAVSAGLRDSGVNNAAHIGGLIGGLLLTLILGKKMQNRRRIL